MPELELTYYDFAKLRTKFSLEAMPGIHESWSYLSGVASNVFENISVIGMKQSGFAYVCFSGKNGPQTRLGENEIRSILTLPSSYKSKIVSRSCSNSIAKPHYSIDVVYGFFFDAENMDYYSNAYVTTGGILQIKGKGLETPRDLNLVVRYPS